jgi:hypothetical protein
MVDTIIEHLGHPRRHGTSNNLTRLGPTTKKRDIIQYIERADDFPSSFHPRVEIYDQKFKKYVELDDDYLYFFKPFGSTDQVADAKSALSTRDPILIRVTWMEINVHHEGEQRLEPPSQIAFLPNQSKLNRSKLLSVYYRAYLSIHDTLLVACEGEVPHRSKYIQ